MSKLGLEKVEELEINCKHSLDHKESKGIPEKHVPLFHGQSKPLTMWIITSCGKHLKEMGIPDHLTCLLRNLYAGQEATDRTLYGTTDWFMVEKRV